MMKKLFTLSLILMVVILAGYAYYHDGTLPVNKTDPTTKVFVVQEGENVNTIAIRLEQAELIRNRVVFFLMVRTLGIEKQIQAGEFRLSTSMTTEEIARALTKATTDRWVTVIEGLRKEEIAEIMAKDFNVSYPDFTKLAKEGYLFPDTYSIPNDADAEKIISIMNTTFNQKFATALRQKSAANTLTDTQIVTLASMIEREAKYPEDRTIVASIMLKRIQNNWPLQIDATVQYMLGYQPAEKTWWKKNLTAADLAVDSPYNTYKAVGLPPTPICNPSLASLEAAAKADPNTPYWYYVNDNQGHLHFAKTLEEHNANISTYVR